MNEVKLIESLRSAAAVIHSGGKYEWGHVGRCNCGHLVQAAFGMNDTEIYRYFGQELDEWSEQVNDYCSLTSKPLQQVFDQLHELGFNHQDIQHLENLSDPKVLKALPGGKRFLRRNTREDVVLYMHTLASVLEQEYGVDTGQVNETLAA